MSEAPRVATKTSSNHSIKNRLQTEVIKHDIDEVKVSEESERDLHDVSILTALSDHILRDCRDNSISTCMVYELQRFIESLELFPQVAEFQIKDLFQHVQAQAGLPMSVILQFEKLQ